MESVTMNKSCSNCRNRYRDVNEGPCLNCTRHSKWEYVNLRWMLLVVLAYLITVLLASGLVVNEVRGDVLGTPIEIPETYEPDC
jgi:hypothetical protein